jgi:microcystin-dependent protein
MEASLNVSGDSSFNNVTFRGDITGLASLNISGYSILNGNVTLNSALSVSGNSTLRGATTCISSLNVSGNSTLQGATTCISSLNVMNNLNANKVYQQIIPSGFGLLVPTGCIIQFGGPSAPDGWLICNGSAISRSTYSTLFATIGDVYGIGNGSTTFNLPDLRGRVPVGAGQGSGLTNRSLADTDGEENHTLTINEIPSHNHGGTLTTSTNGSHTHTSNADGNPGLIPISVAGQSTTTGGVDDDNSGYEPNIYNPPLALTINSSGDHNHTVTLTANGGGASHNIMQPFIVLNYIIKY